MTGDNAGDAPPARLQRPLTLNHIVPYLVLRCPPALQLLIVLGPPAVTVAVPGPIFEMGAGSSCLLELQLLIVLGSPTIAVAVPRAIFEMGARSSSSKPITALTVTVPVLVVILKMGAGSSFSLYNQMEIDRLSDRQTLIDPIRTASTFKKISDQVYLCTGFADVFEKIEGRLVVKQPVETAQPPMHVHLAIFANLGLSIKPPKLADSI
ncbi:hypothetical protein K438DRAFT_1984993 [Mycena galopus ATCC 62051]|nr:hypothetical protein K438DRAFT_1984993 [Mycena galopus ATCC 62051]